MISALTFPSHAYRFLLSDAGKRGENPPLPRNCDRATTGSHATAAPVIDVKSQEPVRRQSIGLLRLRWESRMASDTFALVYSRAGISSPFEDVRRGLSRRTPLSAQASTEAKMFVRS